MDGSARRQIDALGHETRGRRSDVWPPDARMGSPGEGGRDVAQPVWIRPRVIVDVGDDLPRGGFETRVARCAQSSILGANQADVILFGDRGARISRTIVDHDRLVVRVVELFDPLPPLTARR